MNNINLLNKLIINHFEKLKNQQDIIIWSDSSLNDLVYIGSGVPHAVYYDIKLNGVVKFQKSEKELKANLKFIKKSKEEIEKDKDNFAFIYNKAYILIDYKNKLNTLKTFCHIKGYVIYHNIFNFIVAHSPLIEYLENFNDIYTYSMSEEDWLKALPAFLDVVSDFQKLNTTFMFAHGDLQYNCRNIMYKKKNNEFKVIDIEEPSPIILSRPVTPNELVLTALKDVICLSDCYKTYWKPKNFTFSIIKDNLVNEFLNMKECLLCIEDINIPPYVIYHPYNEDCKDRDIYIDTSKQEVKYKIINIINEYYIELINKIEQHIKNSKI